MDWKELDLRLETFRLSPLSAGKEIEARLHELLFGERADVVRAEAFLKENWAGLTGSAGAASRPERLENGLLLVSHASPAAAQEIQLRLLRIKERLLASTGYTLKGFRFEGRERRPTEKRDGQTAPVSDTQKKAPSGGDDPLIADIRRILGLSEVHADLPDSGRTGTCRSGLPERHPGR